MTVDSTLDGARQPSLIQTGAVSHRHAGLPRGTCRVARGEHRSRDCHSGARRRRDRETDVVLAAHLVALVLFPFGVAAAVMQLLPMLLYNGLSSRTRVRIELILIAAGAPLAFAITHDATGFVAVLACLLAVDLALLLGEVMLLIWRAPQGRLIIVNRPACKDRKDQGSTSD